MLRVPALTDRRAAQCCAMLVAANRRMEEGFFFFLLRRPAWGRGARKELYVLVCDVCDEMWDTEHDQFGICPYLDELGDDDA